MQRKNILYFIFPLFIGALLPWFMAACAEHEEVVSPDPSPPDTVVVGTRTLLVYMVATNNLGSSNCDYSDLDEMKQATAEGHLKGGRLLVYHASYDTKLLLDIKENEVDTLMVYDKNAVSVSREQMLRVIADTKELAPAQTYGIVTWGHGTGWLEDGIETLTPEISTYSYGSDSGSKNMNMTVFADVMRDQGFSYIYFDCCYMGSVEVMYELRDCFDYIVACPTEDPLDGIPYQLNIEHFFNPALDIEDAMKAAAKTTFDFYNTDYVKGNCPCSLTVVRTDRIEALAEATLDIYRAADKLCDPSYSYQKFQVATKCNYYDFADYVETLTDDTELLEHWRNALDEAVVYKDATPWIWSSIPVNSYCGLSTYIISSEQAVTHKSYNSTSWYKDIACSLIK